MLFNRLLCLVFLPFFPTGVSESSFRLRGLPPILTSAAASLQLDHVQVVERHQVSVAAKDVHVAFGVDEADVTVAGRRSSASDQAKFVFVLVRGVVVVRSKLLSLLHLLVVQVEAVICILNDERAHHRHRCRC